MQRKSSAVMRRTSSAGANIHTSHSDKEEDKSNGTSKAKSRWRNARTALLERLDPTKRKKDKGKTDGDKTDKQNYTDNKDTKKVRNSVKNLGGSVTNSLAVPRLKVTPRATPISLPASPRRLAPSTDKRSLSPFKGSPSPAKRSPSPMKRSPSPYKRSPSPNKLPMLEPLRNLVSEDETDHGHSAVKISSARASYRPPTARSRPSTAKSAKSNHSANSPRNVKFQNWMGDKEQEKKPDRPVIEDPRAKGRRFMMSASNRVAPITQTDSSGPKAPSSAKAGLSRQDSRPVSGKSGSNKQLGSTSATPITNQGAVDLAIMSFGGRRGILAK